MSGGNNKAKDTLPYFEPGGDLLEEVTAGKLNRIVSAVRERTPHRGVGTMLRQDSGGFSYNAGPGGGKNAPFTPGFYCSVVDDNGVQKVGITPSVVFLNSAYVPENESGKALDDDDPPLFSISGTQTLYIRVEIQPHTTIIPGSSPDAYAISNGAFTVAGGNVTITTTEENQWAEISATTGEVGQNHIVTWPLTKATNTGGTITFDTPHQYMYGPISGQWADGRLAPVAPTFYSFSGFSTVS